MKRTYGTLRLFCDPGEFLEPLPGADEHGADERPSGSISRAFLPEIILHDNQPAPFFELRLGFAFGVVHFFQAIGVALETVGEDEKRRGPDADKDAKTLGVSGVVFLGFHGPDADGGDDAGESADEAEIAQEAEGFWVSFLEGVGNVGSDFVNGHGLICTEVLHLATPEIHGTPF